MTNVTQKCMECWHCRPYSITATGAEYRLHGVCQCPVPVWAFGKNNEVRLAAAIICPCFKPKEDSDV